MTRMNAPKKGKTGARQTVALCLVCLLLLAGCGEKEDSSTTSVAPPASVASSKSVPLPSTTSLPESQPPWPLFEIGTDEVALLDSVLAEWAQQATSVKVVEDEDGEPLDEPYYKEAGGHDVAMWLCDLESGAEYAYNAGHSFYLASLTKAPYATWLYTLADAGECDLARTVTVGPEQVEGYEENTGVIKTMPLPATFTVEQLIGYMIRNSDTVALRVLLSMYPAQGCVQWAAGLGLEAPEALGSVIYSHGNARDVGMLLQAIDRYIRDGGYGAQLREHMANTTNAMITSNYEVVRKYGWDKYAYHDMAVVYAPHPYLLVVLTDKWGGSAAERAMFGTLTGMVEGILEQKWLDAAG